MITRTNDFPATLSVMGQWFLVAEVVDERHLAVVARRGRVAFSLGEGHHLVVSGGVSVVVVAMVTDVVVARGHVVVAGVDAAPEVGQTS